MKCWGIIPAAGSGLRFGSETPKQYLPLNGKAVLAWSLEALLAAPLEAVAVALSPDDSHWPKLSLGRENDPRILACPGGAQRQQSVRNSLEALSRHATADDWVLVHDAVRPCVRGNDIARLLARTAASSADGGILGWPVDNALKRVAPTMALRDNVERRDCWNAATPQMFRHGFLLSALEQAESRGESHVDEAAAVMAAGGEVIMVPCAKDNIKITHEADFVLAGAILAGSQCEAGREPGSETGSETGPETVREAGRKTGREAGRKTGCEAGHETGREAGDEIGSETR